MDKAITTALLIVVGMIAAVALYNGVYPAVLEGSDTIASMAYRAGDRMDTQVVILHAAGELDANGVWQDTNHNGLFDVFVWIKNIGRTRLIGLDNLDVFFGPEGNFARVPNVNLAGGTSPSWDWSLENTSQWTPGATLRLTLQYSIPLSTGRYFFKIGLPNGVTADSILSM